MFTLPSLHSANCATWSHTLLTFRNPVLTGLNPDPSVCVADDVFYLVTSSFAYFPAIPVHRSRDLVHWELIGHVLDRPGQIDLAGLDLSDGIWAPTIRHHDGIFYVVSTVARERRGSVNFISTARDPAGPWSQPVILDAAGIDPSLFFDDDGCCWFTACRDAEDPASTGPAELYLRELNLQTLELVGPLHVLWNGAITGSWAEAPHIYKREGIYHLIAAEGGTERNHAVTAARATSVTGPYRTDPRSPLLTHRHLGEDAGIQNVGHADLVETPVGETWAVVLGTRPLEGVHTLGREVFLVPAQWTSAGLLLAPGRGRVGEVERRPLGFDTGEPADRAGGSIREEFDGPDLPPGWRSLRGPIRGASTGGSAGGLRMPVSAEHLSGRGTPSFAVRRQEHQCFEARTSVTFTPRNFDEQAGLVVFLDERHFAALAVTLGRDGRRTLRLEGPGAEDREGIALPDAEGQVLLRVVGDRRSYSFSWWDERDRQWVLVDALDREQFSSEYAGGFVGVHLGLHATGAKGAPGEALFTWFEYVAVADANAEADDPAFAGVGAC